jgi:Ca2+-binding RTX toxin-like protein
MRRLPALTVTALLVTFALPVTPARAGTSLCSFDPQSATVTVSIGGLGRPQIYLVNGDELYLNSESCGGATTATTDTVVVNASSSDAFDILLATGPFAPGKTDESDGSSEIEFEIFGGPVHLTITGSNGPDVILAGTGAAPTVTTTGSDGALFNLNGDEAVQDADVSVAYADLDTFESDGHGGADVFSAGGFAGAPAGAYVGPVYVLRGSAGDDVISPGLGTTGFYLGGAGTDTLSFAWLPADCDAVLFDGHGQFFYPCDGAAFNPGPFERIVGHAGVDWLSGGGIDQSLFGAGGEDELFATGGNDTLDGGPGRDLAIFDTVGAMTADLRTGVATGSFGAVSMLRMEDLFGSPKNDLLIGDNRGNQVFGSNGDDELKGKGSLDSLDGGNGTDTCLPGAPGPGELIFNCEPP